MATEKTRLLEKYIVQIPRDKYEQFRDENNNNESIVKCSKRKNKSIDLDDEDLDNFAGLTHEQLMPFVHDPWWIKVRHIVFFLYWATFVVILTLSCIISAGYMNKCGLNLIVAGGTSGSTPLPGALTNSSLVTAVATDAPAAAVRETTMNAVLSSPLLSALSKVKASA